MSTRAWIGNDETTFFSPALLLITSDVTETVNMAPDPFNARVFLFCIYLTPLVCFVVMTRTIKFWHLLYEIFDERNLAYWNWTNKQSSLYVYVGLYANIKQLDCYFPVSFPWIVGRTMNNSTCLCLVYTYGVLMHSTFAMLNRLKTECVYMQQDSLTIDT